MSCDCIATLDRINLIDGGESVEPQDSPMRGRIDDGAHRFRNKYGPILQVIVLEIMRECQKRNILRSPTRILLTLVW